MTSIADRIRYLVDTYYGGSVNAASQDLHISQPTLARAVRGTNARGVSSTLVTRICEFFECDPAWMFGTGGELPELVPPDVAAKRLEVLRFKDVLRHLPLNLSITDKLGVLPERVSIVKAVIGDAVHVKNDAGLEDVRTLELRVWRELLSALSKSAAGTKVLTRLANSTAEDFELVGPKGGRLKIDVKGKRRRK